MGEAWVEELLNSAPSLPSSLCQNGEHRVQTKHTLLVRSIQTPHHGSIPVIVSVGPALRLDNSSPLRERDVGDKIAVKRRHIATTEPTLESTYFGQVDSVGIIGMVHQGV